MRYVIAFLAGAGFVVFLFWLGGFDFDKRGEAAFLCGLLSVLVGAIAVNFLGLHDAWSDHVERGADQ